MASCPSDSGREGTEDPIPSPGDPAPAYQKVLTTGCPASPVSFASQMSSLRSRGSCEGAVSPSTGSPGRGDWTRDLSGMLISHATGLREKGALQITSLTRPGHCSPTREEPCPRHAVSAVDLSWGWKVHICCRGKATGEHQPHWERWRVLWPWGSEWGLPSLA